MTSAAHVIDDIVAALEAQGIQVEQYYPELGHGQQELTIRHADALAAADRQVYLPRDVRNVAWRHGLHASLAPKPFPEGAGNGGHIHFSLWDRSGRRTLMHDPRDRYGVSPLGYHFIAGVLHHLPALLALTCATYNSYRRLQPHFWASAYTAWGPDNREAAVRIPSAFRSDRAGSTNAELKACDRRRIRTSPSAACWPRGWTASSVGSPPERRRSRTPAITPRRSGRREASGDIPRR